MQENFSSTKLPTTASQNPSIDGAAWANPNNITADDGSSSTVNYFNGGDFGASITGSDFNFQPLPPSAVIDGIELYIDGGQTGCYGSVGINVDASGGGSKTIGTLSGTYGGPTDLWGLDFIDPADIAGISAGVDTGDVSGGDGSAAIDYMSLTVYWHIEPENVPNDNVPTRFDYKVYSRDGDYLGLLPKVTSKFGFAQDINSAGSSIEITCGKFVKNEVSVSPLLTEAGDVITTEADLPILTTSTELLVTTGDSDDEAIFKNSNRIKVWMYNKYYPNGKLIFSGQVNRVRFKYGGAEAVVKLIVYSDGLDLNNFITRGSPFSYTDDVSQTTQNGYVTVSGVYPGWERFGQTWRTGGSVENVGAISLMLLGTADVTISIYDGPAGNFLGSLTKRVSVGSPTVTQFDAAQLIDTTATTDYFFAVSVATGQTIRLYRNSTSVYANGQMYQSSYAGGSGGGEYLPITGDLYFVTKSGLPTTTTTYTSDDPVSEMASLILADYNARGGYITERDFEATGLSLTYTFVIATIFDAIKKIIELSPTGYYAYIDLGTAEIDIKQMSTTADFTVIRGRHIAELDLTMTIEQVKNYLLFTGGPTAGVNLYQDYAESESVSNYGLRTGTRSDNRVTIEATASAIASSFIEENASETQETTLIVKGKHTDITQYVPGKTVGFRNFGNFIDDMVLTIVRREPNFSDDIVTLTLGRLPVRLNDEVQRINRDLMNEQTLLNPSAPS